MTTSKSFMMVLFSSLYNRTVLARDMSVHHTALYLFSYRKDCCFRLCDYYWCIVFHAYLYLSLCFNMYLEWVLVLLGLQPQRLESRELLRKCQGLSFDAKSWVTGYVIKYTVLSRGIVLSTLE